MALDDYVECFKETKTFHGQTYLPGWYFHDETGDYHGPFATRDEAVAGCQRYCDTVLG